MATLTVDQIQYNGGTALTLPTASPTAGQMLKTDGSANLGWKDRLQKASNASGSVTYNMPTNVVNGKTLGTDGSGTLTWQTVAGDPTTVGTHTGMRLADKISFNSTRADGASSATASVNVANSFNLLIPTTVNAADVQAYFLKCYGYQYSSSSTLYCLPIDKDGTTLEAGNNQGTYCRYSSYNSGNGNNNESSATRISLSLGPSNTCQATETSRGDFNEWGSNNYKRYGFCEFQYYNSKGHPSWSSQYMEGYSTSNYHDQWGVTRGNANYTNTSNAGWTTDHAAGFQIYNSGTQNFVSGVFELYYTLKDGV